MVNINNKKNSIVDEWIWPCTMHFSYIYIFKDIFLFPLFKHFSSYLVITNIHVVIKTSIRDITHDFFW